MFFPDKKKKKIAVVRRRKKLGFRGLRSFWTIRPAAAPSRKRRRSVSRGPSVWEPWVLLASNGWQNERPPAMQLCRHRRNLLRSLWRRPCQLSRSRRRSRARSRAMTGKRRATHGHLPRPSRMLRGIVRPNDPKGSGLAGSGSDYFMLSFGAPRHGTRSAHKLQNRMVEATLRRILYSTA